MLPYGRMKGLLQRRQAALGAFSRFNHHHHPHHHHAHHQDAPMAVDLLHLQQHPAISLTFASFTRGIACGSHISQQDRLPWQCSMLATLKSVFLTSSSAALCCRRTIHTSSLVSQGLVYHDTADRPPRLLVVQPRLYPQAVLRAQLHEALRLADSLEGLRKEQGERTDKELPPYVLVQSRDSSKGKKGRKQVRAGAYFGSGTVEKVRAHILTAESQHELDAVFVNAILTAVQQRNLERVWGKPVLDRVGLIIEIFGAHAETKEARLQVELAALNYKRSRLVRIQGKDGRQTFGLDNEHEVVSARGRASGGRGFISGAGETEIQLQRRRISERKERLLTMLEEVRRTRALHRESRRKYGIGGHGKHLTVVAVVGYTNAGKSSLVSALSRSNLYVEDKLFATLDPRSRSVTLPSGQTVILSDTVGFISDLPIQLVEAFHATLEEVVEADFLLHVIDSSAFDAEEQRRTVLEVLETIGVSKEKITNCTIEVWNKVDLSSDSSKNSSDSLKLEALDELSLLPQEDNPEDVSSSDNDDNTEDAQLEDEYPEDTGNTEEETVKYESPSWVYEGIPRIGTSVVESTGLQELLHLLDKKLQFAPKPYMEMHT